MDYDCLCLSPTLLRRFWIWIRNTMWCMWHPGFTTNTNKYYYIINVMNYDINFTVITQWAITLDTGLANHHHHRKRCAAYGIQTVVSSTAQHLTFSFRVFHILHPHPTNSIYRLRSGFVMHIHSYVDAIAFGCSFWN